MFMRKVDGASAASVYTISASAAGVESGGSLAACVHYALSSNPRSGSWLSDMRIVPSHCRRTYVRGAALSRQGMAGSDPDKSSFQRDGDGMGAIVCSKFGKDAFHMSFHRGF